MTKAALIDLDHLEKYVAGDDALRDEILLIFEEQVDNWIRLLNPHQADEVWREAAHALKGASRGVGAWAAGDLCEEAESLIGPDKHDPVARAALLKELRANLDAVLNHAKELRDKHF
ncbi:MAG: Hpt domain-containing protein [Parvularculaceae bacterium]